MSDPSRPCPACGADNPPGRELCGVCGVDLHSGATLPTPTRREAPDPPRAEDRPVEHHRWVVPLVAVLVGAALLVAGLTYAGFGPLADAPDVPPADFDESRYAGDAAPLAVANVAASQAAGSHPATGAADGDPATAWRTEPGAATPTDDREVLAVLEVGLTEPGWVDRVVVRTGDQQDPDAYADAARPRQVRMVTDAGEVVLADLLDLGLEAQEVRFPEPRLLGELRLEILEVFLGSGEGVLALSEIELSGWTADAEDAELARQREEAALPGGAAVARRSFAPDQPS